MELYIVCGGWMIDGGEIMCIRVTNDVYGQVMQAWFQNYNGRMNADLEWDDEAMDSLCC